MWTCRVKWVTLLLVTSDLSRFLGVSAYGIYIKGAKTCYCASIDGWLVFNIVTENETDP